MKQESPTKLKHHLNFENKGAWRTISIPFNKDVLKRHIKLQGEVFNRINNDIRDMNLDLISDEYLYYWI